MRELWRAVRSDLKFLCAELRPLRDLLRAWVVVQWRLFVMAIKRKSIWAIGFKGFVEIRSFKSGKSPRAVRTEFEKEALRNASETYEDSLGRIRRRTVKIPYKLSLNNVIHTGGLVLKSMDSSSFWRCTHHQIPPGESMKLTRAQALAVLSGKHKS